MIRNIARVLPRSKAWPAIIGAALLLAVAFPASVTAQAPAEAPPGVIRGTVTLASAGERLDEGVEVELIILDDGGVAGVERSTVADGRYEASVAADDTRTYVLRLVYQGVQYFADPVVLRPEAPEATRDFEVYAATSEAPALAIALTIVTVVAIDPEAGQLGIVREDLVTNPTDRAYVGDGRGVTLRLPAPDGTTEAAGDNPDGTTTLEEGVVTTTTPLRALTDTSVITRYLVDYDRATDAYLLRITAPLPTAVTIVRVPETFVRSLRPQGDAREGEPEEFATGEGEPVMLRTVVLQDLAPGDGLLVRLQGFTPQVNRNILTEWPAAGVAALMAALLVGGAAALTVRLRRHEAA